MYRNKHTRPLAVLCALLLAANLIPAALAAPTGKVVDYALYTDIVAEIDGRPIRSFNVSGRTAVVAEDLRGHGFYALWNGAERRISVEWNDEENKTITTTYVPQKNTMPIGARAKPILATDIVADVAGKQVDSFNIDGETLIWFSDLAAFGAVTWDGEARIARLTLGDARQIAVDGLVARLEEHRATVGTASSYTLHENEYGTLFYAEYTGVPHGTSTQFVLVQSNGTQIDLMERLGRYHADRYPDRQYLLHRVSEPRDVSYSEDGILARFSVDVNLLGTGLLGTANCVLDLRNGFFLEAGLLDDSWGVRPEPEELDESPTALNTAFTFTVTRQGNKLISVQEGTLGAARNIWLGANGVTLGFYANVGTFEWGETYDALSSLGLSYSPGDDTPEQRQVAAQWIQVTAPDGSLVTGSYRKGQGNNHVDFYFDFDQPLLLLDGQSVTLRVGNLGQG